jgi:hypothetical protein
MKILGTNTSKFAALLLAAGVSLAQPSFSRRGGAFGFGGDPGLRALTSHTITGAPFSAQWNRQFAQVMAGGNQIQRQEQGNVYRDNQGRVRIETTVTPAAASGQAHTGITIYDPVAGYVYRLNPQKMTAVQSVIRQNASQPGKGMPNPPNSSQVQTQDLGTQTINGVTATGTQLTRTIPAGTIGNAQPIQIVRVTWVSTALQVPVQVTITDPRSGNQAMSLTSIVQSDPSASLFVVPSGYTVTQAPGRAGGRGQFRR